jgi:hypothetical protein
MPAGSSQTYESGLFALLSNCSPGGVPRQQGKQAESLISDHSSICRQPAAHGTIAEHGMIRGVL